MLGKEKEVTVGELIEKLQAYPKDAVVVSITIGRNMEWEYTSTPILSTTKGMFGERVWIT